MFSFSDVISQVMSIKAIGIAIELTLEGINQAVYYQTWIFAMVAITCIIVQLNYLNMVSILMPLNTCSHIFCVVTSTVKDMLPSFKCFPSILLPFLCTLGVHFFCKKCLNHVRLLVNTCENLLPTYISGNLLNPVLLFRIFMVIIV